MPDNEIRLNQAGNADVQIECDGIQSRAMSAPAVPGKADVLHGEQQVYALNASTWGGLRGAIIDVLCCACSASRALTVESVNAKLGDVSFIKDIAELVGVRPIFVASAIVLALFGFLFFGLGGSLVCAVVGIFYPAFESFKVVENGTDIGSMRFWLMYWIVFATITSVEYATFFIIVSFPFYFPLKLGFLLFLLVPRSRGTAIMYSCVARPALASSQESIDRAIDQTVAKLKQGSNQIANSAKIFAHEAVRSATNMGFTSAKFGQHFMALAAKSVFQRSASQKTTASTTVDAQQVRLLEGPGTPETPEVTGDERKTETTEIANQSDCEGPGMPERPEVHGNERKTEASEISNESDNEGLGMPEKPEVHGNERKTEASEISNESDSETDHGYPGLPDGI